MDTASEAPVDSVDLSKSNSESHSGLVEQLLCHQCGGNGYVKSTPSCYHTCLECLGRGIMVEKELK